MLCLDTFVLSHILALSNTPKKKVNLQPKPPFNQPKSPFNQPKPTFTQPNSLLIQPKFPLIQAKSPVSAVNVQEQHKKMKQIQANLQKQQQPKGIETKL